MSDDAPIVPAPVGRPGRELTPTEARERRENRVVTQVAMSMLRKVDGKTAPQEAVEWLRNVASGRTDVAERTRTAAAVALLRAGLDIGAHGTTRGPSVIVQTPSAVHINTRPSIETIRAALEGLAADDRERATKSVTPGKTEPFTDVTPSPHDPRVN